MRHFISTTLNGSIRVWSISRYEDRSSTVIVFGYFDSDSSTPLEVSENKTAYNKRVRDKVKDGYVEVPNLPQNLVVAKSLIADAGVKGGVKEAMKCQKTNPSGFIYPCHTQPKLNGVRSYILWGAHVVGEGMFQKEVEGVTLYSMGGNRYDVPHIAKCFKKEDFMSDVSKGVCDLYFDGELYVHGEKLNVIKSRIPIEINGVMSKPSLPVEPVKFYCFDVAMEDVEYEHRRVIRYNSLFAYTSTSLRVDSVINVGDWSQRNDSQHLLDTSPVVYVMDNVVRSAEEAIAYTEKCIGLGFEGAVLRSPNNLYRFGKRPKDIIKIKNYKDGEFEVIDIIPKPKSRGCLFVCKNDINTETFKSNPEGSYDTQEAWLGAKDLYIGKQVTVKYYERSGVTDCPFHSNVITVRDYE